MLAILQSLGTFIIDLFKSRRRLDAENLFLRHQLSIALRRAPPRLRLRGSDRALCQPHRPDSLLCRVKKRRAGLASSRGRAIPRRMLCAAVTERLPYGGFRV
jgi:hypothetical protein